MRKTIFEIKKQEKKESKKKKLNKLHLMSSSMATMDILTLDFFVFLSYHC